MLDQWQRRFREAGEVEVYASRLTHGVGTTAAGLAVATVAAYLLVSPPGGPLSGLLRIVGVVVGLVAVAVLVYGVRMLTRPLLLLRLTQEGVEVAQAPPARWDEVEGAHTVLTAGMTLAAIRLAPSYWERVHEREPDRARRLRGHAAAGGEDTVVVPSGARGGGHAVLELILWARNGSP